MIAKVTEQKSNTAINKPNTATIVQKASKVSIENPPLNLDDFMVQQFDTFCKK